MKQNWQRKFESLRGTGISRLNLFASEPYKEWTPDTFSQCSLNASSVWVTEPLPVKAYHYASGRKQCKIIVCALTFGIILR